MRRNVLARVFVVAGMLFFLFAFISVLRGHGTNNKLVGAGSALFVMGVALARKAPPRADA
jgi:hypothetical protein